MEVAGRSIIVEAVGQVEILLHLDDAKPLADRVDRASRRIDHLASLDRLPMELVLDRAVERGGTDRRRVHRFDQAQCDRRIGFGRQDDPGLVLAAGKAELMGCRIVGMDLNRQPFACEQIFHEQFARRGRWIVIPYLADGWLARRLIVEQRREIPPPPGLLHPMMGKERHRQLDSPAAGHKAKAGDLFRKSGI